MEEKNKNKPIRQLRSGNRSVSVFDGEKGKSFVLQISYKKDDQWINKFLSIYENEIDSVIAMLKAIRYDDLEHLISVPD